VKIFTRRRLIVPSEKTVSRLSFYHFILSNLKEQNVKYIYSHELANYSNGTPAQVRKDMKEIGYSGTASKGYNIDQLIESLERFFDFKEGVKSVIVGVGGLGRALLTYFLPKKPKYRIVAAFDLNPKLTNRMISGCRCYSMNDFKKIIQKEKPKVGILTVPGDHAQEAASLMVKNGIKGILNFAPVRLKVPEDVFVENLDVTMFLEKVAYFAYHGMK
jgi:redox-sensing transcriptional repressor